MFYCEFQHKYALVRDISMVVQKNIVELNFVFQSEKITERKEEKIKFK